MEGRAERFVDAGILSSYDAEDVAGDFVVVSVVVRDVSDELFDDVEEETVVVGFEGCVVPSCHGPGFKLLEDVGGSLENWHFLDEPLAGKQAFINLVHDWKKNCFESVTRTLNGPGVFC